MAINTNLNSSDPFLWQTLTANEDICNEIFKWLPRYGSGCVGTLEQCSKQMNEYCHRFYRNPALNFLEEIAFVWSECVGRPDAIKWNKVLGFLTAKMLKNTYFKLEHVHIYEINDPACAKVREMFPLWALGMKSLLNAPKPKDIFEFGKNYTFQPQYFGNLFIEGVWSYRCQDGSYFEKIKTAVEQGFTAGVWPFRTYIYADISFDQGFELNLISAGKNVFSDEFYQDRSRVDKFISKNPQYMPHLLKLIYWKIEKLYVYETDRWLGLSMPLKTHLLEHLVSLLEEIFNKLESVTDESKEMFLICDALCKHFLQIESQDYRVKLLERANSILRARDVKTELSNRCHGSILLALAGEKAVSHDYQGAYQLVVESIKLFGEKIPILAIAWEARCLFNLGAYQRAFYRCEAIKDYYALNPASLENPVFPVEFKQMLKKCLIHLRNQKRRR